MTLAEQAATPRVLISPERLQERVAQLADEINRDYADTQMLSCIGVLKGSVFFMTDLLKQITVPLTVDFFQTASYGPNKTPGEVRIRKDIDLSVKGKDVLLIEDIVDTGHTLRTVLALLEFRGARSVKLCALLDKKAKREVKIEVDYYGFEVEPVFVVGYGLDDAELFRNLPYIGVVDN